MPMLLDARDVNLTKKVGAKNRHAEGIEKEGHKEEVSLSPAD